MNLKGIQTTRSFFKFALARKLHKAIPIAYIQQNYDTGKLGLIVRDIFNTFHNNYLIPVSSY